MAPSARLVNTAGVNQAEILQGLLDERGIRDVAARFYDAAMRGDIDAFTACWDADGVWEITAPNQGRWVGTAQLADGQRQFQKLNDFFFGATLPGTIVVDGDTARARFGVVELAARGKSGYANAGFYDDELRRDGPSDTGRWVFTRRTYYYFWVNNDQPFPGQVVGLPDAVRSPLP